jgi:hypothetical protein
MSLSAQVLHIPELLGLIFSFLSTRDLVSVWSANRAFYQVALPLRWSQVHGLEPLVAMMIGAWPNHEPPRCSGFEQDEDEEDQDEGEDEGENPFEATGDMDLDDVGQIVLKRVSTVAP